MAGEKPIVEYLKYYRSIEAIPDAPDGMAFPRIFQITGDSCDRERFRMFAVLGPTESVEQLKERIHRDFDDCYVATIEEEDISYVE